MAEDKFMGNAEELEKIIKENIWFGPKDEALEFLEAMVDNYDDKATELDRTIESIEDDKNEELVEDGEDILKLIASDYGLGVLHYSNENINLDFQIQLEQFIQNFKNNKHNANKS